MGVHNKEAIVSLQFTKEVRHLLSVYLYPIKVDIKRKLNQGSKQKLKQTNGLLKQKVLK